eukprot:TRINITY_DN16483_c0_g1_i1.p1 TRINITY_DN16483_c0_g1~~TRINITY_DN16483_c0_g1_i1.p1  ORF type:complete len:415 (-),score=76.07 TRINITY_DN16483_c0_g1_i1:1403-2647(-)
MEFRWAAIIVSLLFAGHFVAVLADEAGGALQVLTGVKEQLSIAAKLPLQSQKVLLQMLGAGLVASGQLECNLFGGKSSCISIPRDTELARTCVSANRDVDCAFQGGAMGELQDNPDKKMREKLAKEGYPPCPQCFEALHKFWCAQTVPTCGTFEEVLEEILPVLSDIANGKAGPVQSIQAAVPRMLEAFSLGQPCREMCDVVTNTCGCGKSTTFGEIMTLIEAKPAKGSAAEAMGYNTNMSRATAKEIFGSVWNNPVCSLFAPRAQPGFVGVCDTGMDGEGAGGDGEVPVTACGWCKSGKGKKDAGPKDVDAQIVAQMAQAFSGMMRSGLQRVLDSATSSKWRAKASKQWSWQDDDDSSSSSSGGSGWGTFFFWLFIIALAGAGGVFGWQYYQRNQASTQYMDLSMMGYNPPAL